MALNLLFSASVVASETVKITNIGHGYWAGPFYVAQHENLFQKYGLKLESTSVKGGSISLQTALTKQADAAMVTFEHVLKAASKGQRVVSIFRFIMRPLNNVIVKNEVARGSAGLSVAERVHKLKGLRIGVPSAGGSGEKMLTVLANKYGLKLPGDITTVYLGGNPSSYVAAFKKGQIDAAMMFEPAGVYIQQAGLGTTLIDLMKGEEEVFNDLLFMTLTTHPDTIKKKAGLLRKITAVYSEALRIMHTNPARGKEIMAKEFSTLSPEVNDQVYDTMLPIWSRNGRMTEAQGKRVMSYMVEQGGLKVDSNFDITPYFTNDLISE